MIVAVALFAAIHTRLQGMLITGTGTALFVGATVLVPHSKLDRPARPATSGPLPAGS